MAANRVLVGGIQSRRGVLEDSADRECLIPDIERGVCSDENCIALYECRSMLCTDRDYT